ncbi:hypothetical protein D3C73_1131090 [compost metagenome]
MAAQRISGDHHRFARPIDKGDVGQGVRAGLQVGATGFVAIDEQVHRGRHRRFPGKLRQRVGHQIRSHAKIPGHLHAAHAHRTAPGQGAADQIPAFESQQALVIGVAPGGVVAQVAVVQRADRIPRERASILPGIGQRAPTVKQPQLIPRREVGAGIIGVVEVQVVVEQSTEAAQRLGARVGVAVTDKLFRQPVGWHFQQQALTGAVVLAVQARQPIEIDFGAEAVR